MAIRTDLALETYENKELTKLKGIRISDNENLTIIEVLNEEGAKAIGKPVGKYETLRVDSFVNDTDLLDGRLDEFSSVLRELLPKDLTSVLVVGLGNDNITPDSLGPLSAKTVLATRHIVGNLKRETGLNDLFPVSCVTTGVLGNTGIESQEIIKGIVNQVKPSAVIVVDALAAGSIDRLGTTIQFSDTGIFPGSGVGNHRHEISKNTLGVPVISIGIPTVVSMSIINSKEEQGTFVTPREIDKISQQGAKLIGMGINVCLQKSLSIEDLLALVG